MNAFDFLSCLFPQGTDDTMAVLAVAEMAKSGSLPSSQEICEEDKDLFRFTLAWLRGDLDL